MKNKITFIYLGVSPKFDNGNYLITVYRGYNNERNKSDKQIDSFEIGQIPSKNEYHEAIKSYMMKERKEKIKERREKIKKILDEV